MMEVCLWTSTNHTLLKFKLKLERVENILEYYFNIH